MRTALVLCLVSSLAFADPPADAPVRGLVELEPGQPAPVKLSCLPDAEYVASERAAREDHEVAVAVRPGSGNTVLPTWSVVAIAAAGVLLGAGVGIAVVKATEKR